MKLNAKTLTLLKSFTGINNSIFIEAGNVIRTAAASRSVLAQAVLDQDQVFPISFAIGDLSRFVSLLTMLKDVELDFQSENGKVILKSGRQKIRYTFTEEELVQKAGRIKNIDFLLNFSLSQESIQTVLKAAAILSVEEVAIVGDGTTLSLLSIETKNPTSDSFSEEIGTSDRKFRAVFRTEYLKLLPRAYEVSVCPHFALFKAEDIEYFIAVEARSSFFEGV